MEKICTEGLSCDNSLFYPELGKPGQGVCVSKHADLLKPDFHNSMTTGYVVMFQLLKVIYFIQIYLYIHNDLVMFIRIFTTFDKYKKWFLFLILQKLVNMIK